ncbi:hypothetical protein JL721_6382 [Aureococcus anophagefferens]|nr:hypothetical protein JL721_6382 [Aureococcus anophagefferens]
MAAHVDDDPELELEKLPQDLHSLRARDAALDALASEIIERAARLAAAALEPADAAALAALGGAVLVTGAAGYLGAALCGALGLGVAHVGVDVVAGPAVRKRHDVADAAALRASAAGCAAVLHAAALHAPHASSRHADDFVRTNVEGTRNVLALGLPAVHTSTTSLTITPRVKRREQAGELVWLDHASADPTAAAAGDDAPRNKYGRTKLAAERLCVAAAADVVVLRTPRFFPEAPFEDGGDLPNFKANELLGRRAALVDLVDAHLRALARVRRCAAACSRSARRRRWPAASRRAPRRASATRGRGPRLFARRGWRLADAITRVYDPSAAMDALAWRPRVTFASVLRALDGEVVDEAAALEIVLRGAY